MDFNALSEEYSEISESYHYFKGSLGREFRFGLGILSGGKVDGISRDYESEDSFVPSKDALVNSAWTDDSSDVTDIYSITSDRTDMTTDTFEQTVGSSESFYVSVIRDKYVPPKTPAKVRDLDSLDYSETEESIADSSEDSLYNLSEITSDEYLDPYQTNLATSPPPALGPLYSKEDFELGEEEHKRLRRRSSGSEKHNIERYSNENKDLEDYENKRSATIGTPINLFSGKGKKTKLIRKKKKPLKFLSKTMKKKIQQTPVEEQRLTYSPSKNLKRQAKRFKRYNSEDLEAETIPDGMNLSDYEVNIYEVGDEGLVLDTQTDKVRLIAGTFNQLIRELTSLRITDLEYADSFILTYKSFATPIMLLNKICERYDVPEDYNDTDKLITRSKCVDILSKWLREEKHDFTESMLVQIQELHLKVQEHNGTLGDKLEKALMDHIVGLREDYRIQFDSKPPKPKILKNWDKISWLKLDSVELARQITLYDWDAYSSIKSINFLSHAWCNKSLKHKAKELLKLIDRVNSLSKFTIYVILKEEDLKRRAKVYGKILDVAWELHEMNNFSSCVALISGLQSSSVYRLALTKSKITNEQKERETELMKLLEPEDNYDYYKTKLSQAIAPCIPFLGIFLTDIIHLEDLHQDMLDEKRINFHKRKLIYDIIMNIRQFTSTPYNFVMVEQIQNFLTREFTLGNTMNDVISFQLSIELEPRVQQQ
eukprot:TRINITY_DN3419_c0_g1_i1.p1 TRINITY_DN3419_c0_g1~~TRINITY_DN3419_c0_g1_i1.p1  ORF type:complete len:712 (-),score=126.79 TRINITY_DN3419_c0_g1_i1:31-2166(-)